MTLLTPDDQSEVTIHLLKGPLYRDSHDKLWAKLTEVRHRVADHVGVIGLRLEVDESEGYAYLRSAHEHEVEHDEFPRLVNRHALGFRVSLMIALLRKRLAEFDADSTDTRLVLGVDQIVDMVTVYLPDSADDIARRRDVEADLRKVQELGFVHKLRGADDQFEVRRIIRAFVDGQWLADFDARLQEYVDQSLATRDAES